MTAMMADVPILGKPKTADLVAIFLDSFFRVGCGRGWGL